MTFLYLAYIVSQRYSVVHMGLSRVKNGFHQIVLCLNVPKINFPVSRVFEVWTNQTFFLAHGDRHSASLCVQRPRTTVHLIREVQTSAA